MPGRDISIIGCDDMEEARLTYPPLTTIAVDKAGIGRQASRSLLSPQNGQHIVILPPQLVLRGTVGQAAQPGQAPS